MLSNFKTQSQIDRDPAKKNAGGQTEEGKSKIRSQRHAPRPYRRRFIVNDEDRRTWEAFSKPLIDSLKPADPMELQLARLIAQDNYRLNRIHAIEEKHLYPWPQRRNLRRGSLPESSMTRRFRTSRSTNSASTATCTKI
jgi:hypothetical protein